MGELIFLNDYPKKNKSEENDNDILLEYGTLAPKEQLDRFHAANYPPQIKKAVETLVNDYQIKLKVILDKLESGKLPSTIIDIINQAERNGIKNYSIYRLLELSQKDISKKGLEEYKLYLEAIKARQRSLSGNKTAYKLKRKMANIKGNFMSTTLALIIVFGLASGTALAIDTAVDTYRNYKVGQNIEAVAEYSQSQVPENYSSYQDTIDDILDEEDYEAQCIKLYEVAFKEYCEKYGEPQDGDLVWHNADFNNIVRFYKNNDRKIAEAFDKVGGDKAAWRLYKAAKENGYIPSKGAKYGG